FFGHLKDEMNYENCTNLEELRATVSDYIDYYNNERGQWNLKNCPLFITGNNFYQVLHKVSFFKCL
ncbi:IS3 family transposase, partial [Marinilactibacillus psychrotolerans]|uniref:IS3 family transposase n=1 Tax=Marinilactibacillus psychrotolerans TaxID=191770 RepID=UPI00388AECFB